MDSSAVAMMTSMAEDSGFRDIERKPNPGWKRWRPPPPEREPRWGLRGKTVWDWLQLLIVPIILSLITVVFTVLQNTQQNHTENQRAKADRELADQRAQDEALQAYLDQMNNLLLEHNLRNSKADSGVRTLARARTLTVLDTVNSSRKTRLMQFLTEAELVQEGNETDPIIPLTGAALRGAYLGATNLTGANLEVANLKRANLRLAILGGALLAGANLKRANLEAAYLHGANLSPSINMGHTSELGSIVGSTPFMAVPQHFDPTNLEGANLRDADLSAANLSAANLKGVDLGGANLKFTFLKYANLKGAKNITNQELEEQARSLEGAIMPNGQKYEDWLKDKQH